MSFTDFNKYTGHQQIITSDRVIINAKEDAVFILAKETIGFSVGGSFHVNTGDEVIVNAPRIQLGLSTNGKLEPIAKGESTEQVMNDILSALSSFSSQLTSAQGVGAGIITLPTINAAAAKLTQDIARIKNKVEKIKSKVTYSI